MRRPRWRGGSKDLCWFALLNTRWTTDGPFGFEARRGAFRSSSRASPREPFQESSTQCFLSPSFTRWRDIGRKYCPLVILSVHTSRCNDAVCKTIILPMGWVLWFQMGIFRWQHFSISSSFQNLLNALRNYECILWCMQKVMAHSMWISLLWPSCLGSNIPTKSSKVHEAVFCKIEEIPEL